MNKQQAINLLKNLEQSLDDYCELNDEGKTAFRMAITALNCSEFPNSSDTISRQAAIDAHYEYCNKHPDAGFPVWSLKILEDLPSAQPETHEERTETHACDLISRQAAIEAITDLLTW